LQNESDFPSERQLEIKAVVSYRDIGFAHTGQEAEIKIDTFDRPSGGTDRADQTTTRQARRKAASS